MEECQMDYAIAAGRATEADVAAMLAASEAYAHTLYPPESVHMLEISQLALPTVYFAVARAPNGVAHGCGAIVLGENASAELKRMFVLPEARGRGLGARLLEHLEQRACRLDVRVMRLETGVAQPEAIRLYQRFGYINRGPFGGYEFDPSSVYMEKVLAGVTPTEVDGRSVVQAVHGDGT
jgi:putative acetyltransferase